MPSFCQVHIKYSHIGSTGRPPIKKETSKTAFIRYNRGFILLSGESGIRTPDRLASITVFKTAAFNHSANSPNLYIFSKNAHYNKENLSNSPSVNIKFIKHSQKYYIPK